MQCMHCGTELHPQAQICWKCGKVPAEGIEPLYAADYCFAPSEVILVSDLDPTRDNGDTQSVLMSAQTLNDTIIVMMFSAALLACERAGILRLDIHRPRNPWSFDNWSVLV